MDKTVLRLGFVPGVVPFKWVSRFRDRFGEAALVTSRLGADDDVAQLLSAGELDAALMPVSLPGVLDAAAAPEYDATQEIRRTQLVDKEVFHAIPLYIESDDQKGRVPGREIGLVWLRGPSGSGASGRGASVPLHVGAASGRPSLRGFEHQLIEPLTGIVRGRTANSSRGASEGAPNADAAAASSGKVPRKPPPATRTERQREAKPAPRQGRPTVGKNVRSNAKSQNSKNSGRRQRRAK